MKKILVLLAILLLNSCGGGGGNSDSTTPTNNPITNNASTLTINVVAAPVNGASCKAYKITKNAKGELISSATSNNGQAIFKDFSHTGSAFFQCTGGEYLDEATNATTSLKSLSAALKLTTTTKEYSVTPLTDIAVKIASSDLDIVISTHNAKVADQFGLDGLDITQNKPIIASDTGSNKYGLVLAAISQMGQNRGGTNNATSLLSVVEAVVADLTDGEISTNTLNDFKTSVINIKSNPKFNFNDIDIVDDLGSDDNTSPEISITSNTVSYVYDGTTPVKPTATITDNSTTTGIIITGNIDKNVGVYVLTYTATDSAGNKAIPQIATITITPKLIIITANPASKVYGENNPSFNHNGASKLLGSDTLSGTLGSSGVNVGTHNITSTLNNSNYLITFVGENKFSISKKPITITANVVTKVYGTANPSFSDDRTTKLLGSDTLSGTLGSSGVNVGSYDITSTLNNSNYLITFVGVNKFSISKKAITITANVATKVYGTANPNFTYASVVGLVGSDSLTGTLGSSVSINTDVGIYNITSSLSHNNYDITFIGANKFSIIKASQPAFSAGNDQVKTFVSGAISGTTFTIMTTGALSTNQATYSTSNANIATIDANGVITLKAAGTVTIGATSTADNNYQARYSSFILTIYPTTTTLANATATSYDIKLAWSAVAGVGISYKVYYASETIIGFTNLATNYPSLSSGTLINNLTTTATTVFNLKRNVVYHFVVTVLQNNVESAISNQVTSTLQKPAAPTTGTINDTGITFAGDYPAGTNTTCTSNIASPQDCHQGRDAKAEAGILGKFGDGSAGFDFTKLGSTGTILAIQNQKWSAAATSTEALGTKWSCVRDNYTGLIWEVKTATSNIHNKDNTYKWGGIGADSYSSILRHTDWNTLVNGSNTNNLCGFNNWRLPNNKELRSIVDYSRINPSIDTDYFPNTVASYFWSSSTYVKYPYLSWLVYFNYGNDLTYYRDDPNRVRLVRSGQ